MSQFLDRDRNYIGPFGNDILIAYFVFTTRPEAAVVNQLIRAKVSINHRNMEGTTAFVCAANDPNTTPAVLESLIAAGADPHAKNRYKMNAFTYLVNSNVAKNVENVLAVAELLHAHQVDLNCTDHVGNTPLLSSAAKFKDFP